jgi:hypothetical protein
LASNYNIKKPNVMEIEGIGANVASKFETSIAITTNFSTCFQKLDNEELHNVYIDRRWRSKHSKSWATNLFYEWRKSKGYTLDYSIKYMNEAIDVHLLMS